MTRLNGFLIICCILITSFLLYGTYRIYGDVSQDLLTNLCISVLTIGFTVLFVDVSRENSRKRKIKKFMPAVSSEIQTSGNAILSLVAVRMYRNDAGLMKDINKIRLSADWNQATILLLQRAQGNKLEGAEYLKDFDKKYLKIIYDTAKSEEASLMSIYSRYPHLFEDFEFTKVYADFTKSVRQIIWAYDELYNASDNFLMNYGKEVGVKTKDPVEVFRYHMFAPIKIYIGAYSDFIVHVSADLNMPKNWYK